MPDYDINGINSITIKNNKNGLLNGRVDWLQNLNFRITELSYYLNNDLFNTQVEIVSLQLADATHSRIDVFIADVSGNVGVLTGAPGPNPVKPEINPLTQIELTFVIIEANSTEPQGVSNQSVFSENLGQPSEWDAASTSGAITFNDTTNPATEANAIAIQNYNHFDTFSFTNDTPISNTNLSHLKFKIKNGSSQIGFLIHTYNGNTLVSGEYSVIFKDDSYGYTSGNISEYQDIIIPKEDFEFTDTNFDRLEFKLLEVISSPSNSVHFIDDIVLTFETGTPENNTLQDIIFYDESGNQKHTSQAKLQESPLLNFEELPNGHTRINITEGNNGNNLFLGEYDTEALLESEHPTPVSQSSARINPIDGNPYSAYWDDNATPNAWVYGNTIGSGATTIITGTELQLNNNIQGIIANQSTPSLSNNFNVSSIITGGYLENYINTTGKTSFPTLNNSFGPVQQTQSNTFREGANFKMIVKAVNATDVEYYFIDYLNSNQSPLLPATSLLRIDPLFYTPNTAYLLRIYSDYITPLTTVSIEGDTTVTNVYYNFDNNNIPVLDVSGIASATVGNYNLTINNGTPTVFNAAFQVSLGPISVPSQADWTIINGVPDLSFDGEIRVTTLGNLGRARWDQDISYNSDWEIDLSLRKSDLGYNNNSGDFFLRLKNISNGADQFTIRNQAFTPGTIWVKSTTPQDSDTTIIDIDRSTQEEAFDVTTTQLLKIRFIGGVLSIQVNGITRDTLTHAFTENMKLEMSVRHYDIKGIKYTEIL